MAESVTESPEIRVEIPESATSVDGSGPEHKRAREPIFQLDDVTVSYGDKPAVRNVSYRPIAAPQPESAKPVRVSAGITNGWARCAEAREWSK